MIVLARPLQRREVVENFQRRGRRIGAALRGAERQHRRAGKRRAHQRHRAEHIRPHQRAIGRDRRAEIVPDHGRDRAMAEREGERQRIFHDVENAERREVAVVGSVPAGGAAIAALVRCNDVKSGCRQRQHHLAPAIGELRKAVQQQDARPASGFVTGLQHVHREAVDVVDETRADAARQRKVGDVIRHGSSVPEGAFTAIPCADRIPSRLTGQEISNDRAAACAPHGARPHFASRRPDLCAAVRRLGRERDQDRGGRRRDR